MYLKTKNIFKSVSVPMKLTKTLMKSYNCCRVIGAVIICLGLYAVVWGKSKDCSPRSPNTQEPILLAKQIVNEDNAKKENCNCTHEVINANNFENGITRNEEQV